MVAKLHYVSYEEAQRKLRDRPLTWEGIGALPFVYELPFRMNTGMTKREQDVEALRERVLEGLEIVELFDPQFSKQREFSDIPGELELEVAQRCVKMPSETRAKEYAKVRRDFFAGSVARLQRLLFDMAKFESLQTVSDCVNACEKRWQSAFDENERGTRRFFSRVLCADPRLDKACIYSDDAMERLKPTREHQAAYWIIGWDNYFEAQTKDYDWPYEHSYN